MTDFIIATLFKNRIETAAANLPTTASVEYTIADLGHVDVRVTTPVADAAKWPYGILQVTSGDLAGACFVIHKVVDTTIQLHLPMTNNMGIQPGDKVRLLPGPLKDVRVWKKDPATIDKAVKAGKKCFIVITALGGDVVPRAFNNEDMPLIHQDVDMSFDIAVDCIVAPVGESMGELDAGYNEAIPHIAGGQVLAILFHFIHDKSNTFTSNMLLSEGGAHYDYALKERPGYKDVLECMDISLDFTLT